MKRMLRVISDFGIHLIGKFSALLQRLNFVFYLNHLDARLEDGLVSIDTRTFIRFWRQ